MIRLAFRAPEKMVRRIEALRVVLNQRNPDARPFTTSTVIKAALRRGLTAMEYRTSRNWWYSMANKTLGQIAYDAYHSCEVLPPHRDSHAPREAWEAAAEAVAERVTQDNNEAAYGAWTKREEAQAAVIEAVKAWLQTKTGTPEWTNALSEIVAAGLALEAVEGE